MITAPLGMAFEWGFLDRAEIDPLGFLRLTGWSQRPTAEIPLPAVSLAGHDLAPFAVYRTPRPDVAPGDRQAIRQAGLVIEHRLATAPADGRIRLTGLSIDGRAIALDGEVTVVTPHYANLLDTAEVLGREHIYGEGPPQPAVSDEVLDLVAGLSGRVLDFGCGSGALVMALRGRGIDAHGLEIDRPAIRQALHEAARPHVTLYDGALPSPFADAAFDAVVSSEVLEHIPAPFAALAEMARLARRTLVLTVPDIAMVPHGFRHGVTPWHLLEGTHVNFFTQKSLAAALAPHFATVEFGRITPFVVNGTLMHTSLAAVCQKPSRA